MFVSTALDPEYTVTLSIGYIIARSVRQFRAESEYNTTCGVVKPAGTGRIWATLFTFPTTHIIDLNAEVALYPDWRIADPHQHVALFIAVKELMEYVNITITKDPYFWRMVALYEDELYYVLTWNNEIKKVLSSPDIGDVLHQLPTGVYSAPYGCSELEYLVCQLARHENLYLLQKCSPDYRDAVLACNRTEII